MQNLVLSKKYDRKGEIFHKAKTSNNYVKKINTINVFYDFLFQGKLQDSVGNN